MSKLDLDVNDPREVIGVLEDAADAYYDSASELEAAHQSRSAGTPWVKLARILERAAASARKALKDF